MSFPQSLPQMLENQRGVLLNRIQGLSEDRQDTRLAWDAQSKLQHSKNELYEVEQALQRWAVGTYGICQLCQKPINPERLEIAPTVEYCVPCQRLTEKRPWQRSRQTLSV